MPTPLEILNDIQIASPCPVPWSDMTGDDRVRHCSRCNRQVFDVSALTAQQSIDLIVAKQGNLCIQLYRRKDGTVLTADCPVGIRARARRAWRRSVAVVAAVFAFLWVGGCQSDSESGSSPTSKRSEKEECTVTGGVVPLIQPLQQPDANGNISN